MKSLQNILKKVFFILILIFGFQITNAANIPIENVFTDITTDYKYYHELQTLYDRGMIFPDDEGKFNPQKLLNRDEFTGIVTEVTCEDCIAPGIDYELIKKYTGTTPFFDVPETNKYFYCIADAEDKGRVFGYHAGTACENGTQIDGQAPFCPANTIILEEALAIVLRASGILTNFEAEQMRMRIANGEITEYLSNDVSPLNTDGSVYSFYPDFKKALEYELVEYDKEGNEKIYNLVQMNNNNLNPKQAVTKEDFLYIAYAALKANSCIDKKDWNIGLSIVFYPTTCNASTQSTCTPATLTPTTNKIYDLFAHVELNPGDSITNDNQYIWRVYEYMTGVEKQFVGKYIDNYDFGNNGKYRVYLRVISDAGATGEVHRDINFSGINDQIDSDNNSNDNDLKVSINAKPIYGDSPLYVEFEGIVTGGTNNKSYFWDYGDGSKGYGKNTDHIFKEPGNYEVTLTVIDDNNINSGTVLIEVKDNDGEIGDYDGDGLNDLEDACPTIPGPIWNKGCPISGNQCETDEDCPAGYYCLNGVCVPKEIATNCYYSGGDVITGNIACNTCPCEYTVDFVATLKKCDLIFPAIISPDGSTIYSKGNYFEVR